MFVIFARGMFRFGSPHSFCEFGPASFPLVCGVGGCEARFVDMPGFVSADHRVGWELLRPDRT